MEQYGYTAQQLSTLNIPNFIFNNLIPVTIGNIVGGMAFFGIPLMYIMVLVERRRETYLKVYGYGLMI